ncbi:AEC family transporter [Konateibacter massiliensis]|uniref:AEC family transporter n=1 Tax=Konateibacter massiliensis TaxID=2002841 RepID=UPI000C14548E|nr:AEC family transporter [Konateibacter massiliensis]
MGYLGIIDTMFKLFALLLLGYFFNKKKYFDEDTNARLSNMVVQFTAPALIISSVCNIEAANKMEVLKIVGIGVIIYIVMPILAFLIVKLIRVEKDKAGIYQMLIIFSNCSFMSYPIVQALYGDAAIFYNTLFHMPFNILIFTYGEYLLAKDEGGVKVKLKDILSPGLLAALAAALIYFAEIPVPSFIAETASFLGGITTPMSMIILGSVLGNYPIKDLFNEKKLYLVAVIKLIVIPIAVWLIFKNVFTDPIIIGVATLSMGMPAASMCVMLSLKYEGQEKTASVGVFLTTLLSMVSIPAIYILLLK